ncbi:MAG TPA: hypothetical protein PKM12_09200 [Marmoricola sp.]|nr:hypothetical protein [Marmoricola sp.]HNI70048.1 hypothetical protein [Marmoricola sp.]HNN49143.1 hypothetical protein [Marmoricola sp.]
MDEVKRPPQATTAMMAVVVASAFLVVSAFDGINSSHSIATQEALAKAIDDPVFKQVGFTAAHFALLIRAAWMVTAASAAASFVLAWYIPQRHHAARIALALTAFPAIAMIPFTGSLIALLLGFGAGLLWTQPMREWYSAKPVDRASP